MKAVSVKSKKITDLLRGLFFVGLACFGISGVFGFIDSFETFSDILSIAGISFTTLSVVLNIVNKRLYGQRRLLLMIPIILVAFLSYIIVRDFTVLKLLLIMLGSLVVPFKQIVSFDLKVRVAVVCLVMILSAFAIIPSGDVLRASGEVRHALGFAHPNILGMYILIIVLEMNYLFLRHKKALIVFNMLSILFELLVPNSRMPAVIIGAMMIYVLARDLVNKILVKKVVRWIVVGSFVIFSSVSIVFGVVGPSGEFFGGLNKITSNRLNLYHKAMETTDITILGNSKENNVHNSVLLDNAYLELLLTFGVLQMLIYLIFSVQTYRALYEKKDYALILILFLMGWFGLAETAYIYVTVNIFLASYGILLTGKENENKRR
ncbi:hypothetical protein IKG73_01280 [Candidatus Saccharibacteria bacterium]|nr:hypothetical protein [Candidatus Saccharibacteria bacterium]